MELLPQDVREHFPQPVRARDQALDHEMPGVPIGHQARKAVALGIDQPRRAFRRDFISALLAGVADFLDEEFAAERFRRFGEQAQADFG